MLRNILKILKLNRLPQNQIYINTNTDVIKIKFNKEIPFHERYENIDFIPNLKKTKLYN